MVLRFAVGGRLKSEDVSLLDFYHYRWLGSQWDHGPLTLTNGEFYVNIGKK